MSKQGKGKRDKNGQMSNEKEGQNGKKSNEKEGQRKEGQKWINFQ